MPDDETMLSSLIDNQASFNDGQAPRPTMESWRKHRTARYGKSALSKREDGHDEEVIEGVVVKHYN